MEQRTLEAVLFVWSLEVGGLTETEPRQSTSLSFDGLKRIESEGKGWKEIGPYLHRRQVKRSQVYGQYTAPLSPAGNIASKCQHLAHTLIPYITHIIFHGSMDPSDPVRRYDHLNEEM